MRPGTQVWAKVEGYRWWPAHVLDPNDHREEMRDAPKLPDRAKPVLVRFHHTQDIGFMAPSKVLDFAEHVKEKSAGGKKSGGFAQAVAAAKAALGMATEGTNGDHGGDQNPAIDDSNKKTKAPAPTSVDKDNDVGHTKPPSGTKLERTPRVSERDVEAARPRRQAAAAGEQRREGPKVIPGELGAAAGYLHGAASRAQERLEAGLSDAEDGSDTEDGSDSDASSDGEDAGEKAARALGGFAASGRSTSIGAERGVDDFEVRRVEEHRLDVAFVYGPVHLRAWSSHGGPLGRVEDPELDPGGVRGGAHDPAERVDLAYERALGEASDGWVAGHLADGAERGWGDERDARAPTRGGGGGLGARVASADDDDVEVGGGLGGGGREAPRASVGGC